MQAPLHNQLQQALSQKNLKWATQLINAGANVNALMVTDRTTLLHSACENAYIDGIILLLSAGANPSQEVAREFMYGTLTVKPCFHAWEWIHQKDLRGKTMLAVLDSMRVLPKEIRSILGQLWAFKQPEFFMRKDLLIAHIKPHIVQALVLEKMAIIKRAICLEHWDTLDKAQLQKALKINIIRALNADRAQSINKAASQTL